jgi:hypothetical protein
MRHLAEHRTDERRLAAAIGADDAVDSAGLDRKTDVLQNVGVPQTQVDVFKFDARAGHKVFLD